MEESSATVVSESGEFHIIKTPIEDADEMVDAMEHCHSWSIGLDEHGSVTLIDVMPRYFPKGSSPDYAIAESARVSYGKGTILKPMLIY